jgi:hypothetical protein
MNGKIKKIAGLQKKTSCVMALLLLLFFLLSGCAGSPVMDTKPVVNSKIFTADSFDAAWHTLLGVLFADGALITFSEKESGIVVCRRIITPSEIDAYSLNNSGMLWNKAQADIVLLVTQVTATSVRITINTKIIATGRGAFDVILGRTREIGIASNGVLEQHYFNAFIQAKPL